MSIRMLTSRVKFLTAITPLSRIGQTPTATAATASHWKGWYTYLRNDSASSNPEKITYGLGHFPL